MKAKLIEYDYTYQDWDACKGTREKEASNRAIMFFDTENRPVAIAIPEDGKLNVERVFLRNNQLFLPVWSKEYTITSYQPAPFQHYRVIKSLTLPSIHLDLILHAVVCCMKMDDLRHEMLELIRAESKNFAYII